MLGRLLLIGDVHAETTRLRHVLEHAARTGPDRILCVGDVVDGAEDAAACVALLQAHQVETVRGNHERWLADGRPLEPFVGSDEARTWLGGLPLTRPFETVAGPLLLGHGVGEDDMVRLLPDDQGYALESNLALQALIAGRRYRYLVGGHTHRRMIRRFGELTVLNPGTLARRDDPGCLEVDLVAGVARWLRVDLQGVEVERELALP